MTSNGSCFSFDEAGAAPAPASATFIADHQSSSVPASSRAGPSFMSVTREKCALSTCSQGGPPSSPASGNVAHPATSAPKHKTSAPRRIRWAASVNTARLYGMTQACSSADSGTLRGFPSPPTTNSAEQSSAPFTQSSREPSEVPEPSHDELRRAKLGSVTRSAGAIFAPHLSARFQRGVTPAVDRAENETCADSMKWLAPIAREGRCGSTNTRAPRRDRRTWIRQT